MPIPTKYQHNPKNKKDKSMHYYFEVHRSTNRYGMISYWSRIKARNGRIVWTSEMYRARQNAERPVLKLMSFIGKKKCSLIYFNKGKKV